MIEVGYDRLNVVLPSAPVGPIALTVPPAASSRSLVVAIDVSSKTRLDEATFSEDNNCVVVLW